MSGPVVSVIKSLFSLPTRTAKAQEGCLALYSAIFNYLLKRYATKKNIATVDDDIQTFKQQDLTATDCAQKLWKKTLRYGSVHAKKILEGLFVEGANKSIRRALRQWWSDHQLALLKQLAQKAELLTDLQENKQLPTTGRIPRESRAAENREQTGNANFGADE